MWTQKSEEVRRRILRRGAPVEQSKQSQEGEGGLIIQHLTYDEAHQSTDHQFPLASPMAKFYTSSLSSDALGRSGSESPKSPWSENSTSEWVSSPRSAHSPRNPWIEKERRGSRMLGNQVVAKSYEPVMRNDVIEKEKVHLATGLRKRGSTLADTMISQSSTRIIELRKNPSEASDPRNPVGVTPSSGAVKIPVQNIQSKFSKKVKEAWSRAVGVSDKNNLRDKSPPTIEKLQSLRYKMQQGKIERVIQTSHRISSWNEGRLPPPRPQNPLYQTFSTTSSAASIPMVPHTRGERGNFRRHPRNRTTKSSSSPITSFFESGVEALDSTRRELQERFRPSFEHINYPSFSLLLPRRSSCSSEVGSDESFYCQGERQFEKEISCDWREEIIQERIGEAQAAKEESGEGDETPCNLCGRRGLWSYGYLCGDCRWDSLHRDISSMMRTQLPMNVDILDAESDPQTISLNVPRSKTHTSPFQIHGNVQPLEDTKPPLPEKNPRRLLTGFKTNTPLIQSKPNIPSIRYVDTSISPENGAEMAIFKHLRKSSSSNEFETVLSLFDRWSESFSVPVGIGKAAVRIDRNDEGESQEYKEQQMAFRDNQRRRELGIRDGKFYAFWERLILDKAL